MLNLSTRALALAFVCVLVASFVAPVAAQDGDGAPPVEFVIEPTATEAVSGAALVETAATFPIWGHGWGHGRGLGQYGSLGYATEEGWTSSQILDHFYGDTTAGNVGNSLMTVRLESSPSEPLNGPLVVTVASGTLGYRVGPDPADTVTVGPGAMRVDVLGMTASGGGIYRIFHGPGCGGPWTPVVDNVQLPATPTMSDHVAIVSDGVDTNAPNLPLEQTLQLCGSGSNKWYRGELRAAHFEGEQRLVSALPTEQYLRSVVPRESPASWADIGGMAALQAQAVAARSYSLAESRFNYAKTCDTISCQVYSGRQIGAFPGEDARSDTAIANTAGVVRMRGAAVARTEFSSSTGGHTAGGVFPAVVDAGDDISSNPNHDWAATVSKSSLESSLGAAPFQSAQVLEQNGLGADGGRVTKVRVVAGGTAFEMLGTSFQAKAGLKSDWFRFTEAGTTGAPTTMYISNSLSTGVASKVFGFGTTDTEVFVGDWDGDGVDTFLMRTGNRFRGSNTLSSDIKSIDFSYGKTTDEIFVGDWNGNGRDTLAVRRGNVFYPSVSLGGPSATTFGYGKASDEVFVGDWNGDGLDTFAVRRGNVFFASDRNVTTNADYVFGYGRAGEQTYVGDWDRDGDDSFAVRRQNVFHVSNQLVTSVAQVVFGYGKAGDEVFVGDFDADGVETIAVRR